MQRTTRFSAVALLAAFIVTTLFGVPVAARASEEGHRNTALGLGALSAGLLLTQKNKLPGLLAAGGAVYAYSQSQHAMVKRHRRERNAAYHVGFRRGATYARYHRRRR